MLKSADIHFYTYHKIYFLKRSVLLTKKEIEYIFLNLILIFKYMAETPRCYTTEMWLQDAVGYEGSTVQRFMRECGNKLRSGLGELMSLDSTAFEEITGRPDITHPAGAARVALYYGDTGPFVGIEETRLDNSTGFPLSLRFLEEDGTLMLAVVSDRDVGDTYGYIVKPSGNSKETPPIITYSFPTNGPENLNCDFTYGRRGALVDNVSPVIYEFNGEAGEPDDGDKLDLVSQCSAGFLKGSSQNPAEKDAKLFVPDHEPRIVRVPRRLATSSQMFEWLARRWEEALGKIAPGYIERQA